MPNSLRDTDLIPLHAWLIEAGTNDVAAETLFDGFCGRTMPATPALRRERIKLQVALITPLTHVSSASGLAEMLVDPTRAKNITAACAQLRAKPTIRRCNSRGRSSERNSLQESVL